MSDTTTEQAKVIVKKPMKAKDEIMIPDKALIVPVINLKFRLGMEQTTENYVRIPGTTYRWEPSRRGDTYLTGLNRISNEQVKELERELGKRLDNKFYEELTYGMDGSNPYGHHMDLSKAYEKVVYLAMMESHLIAPSFLNTKDGSRPQAEWYIENAEAEAEMESLEKDKFLHVIELYKELSQFKKVAFCKIMSMNVNGLSPKVADNLLWKKLNEKNIRTKMVQDKFIAMCAWSDEKVNVSEEVEDCISKNVIRRNSAQDYVYGDDILGSTKEQVVSKLLTGDNGGLRAAIKTKLALRK